MADGYSPVTDSRADVGWLVEPKPSPPELAEGYKAAPFEPHGWSFLDLIGPEGAERLAKAIQ